MTKLFYFTGTGNTLYVTWEVAARLGNAQVEPVTRANPVIADDVDTVGIFFPVHGWGMPTVVRDFVDKLENCSGKYLFAVCTYGGTLFASLKITQIRLQKKGFALDAGFGLRMPVNYIPIFTVLSKKREAQIIEKAAHKIERIAATVQSRTRSPIERWNVPVISRLLLTMNGKMADALHDHDKKFHTTDACDGCGICASVCPVVNITLKDKRPEWHHSCVQCLACLHWCPQAAIRYANVPASRGQYHHPRVTLDDMRQQQSRHAST